MVNKLSGKGGEEAGGEGTGEQTVFEGGVINSE